MWEAWMRQWRTDPPTPEEDDVYRANVLENMGVHALGDEEPEDAMVRCYAHTRNAPDVLMELDDEQKYNKFLNNTEDRDGATEPLENQENEKTWTAGFARGDIFYNEEETEVMRDGICSLMRDKEWQTLEMKRQVRLKKQKKPVRRPDVDDPYAEEDPIQHNWDRDDQGVPFGLGVADITTPELERLKAECDALEDERVKLKKELGLTDIGDIREGRPAVDRGYAPLQPSPTTQRWKPHCWGEAWGAGGAQWHSPN
jgi:hypothetical protein